MFNYDSKIYKNSKSIANGFYIFFVNVGPKLAKNIEKINGSILDTMIEPSKKSFCVGEGMHFFFSHSNKSYS